MEFLSWILYSSTPLVACFYAVLFLVTLLLLSVIIKYAWEVHVTASVDRQGFQNLNLPPGTLGYPLIGETISFLRRGCVFYKEKLDTYGKIYKTHLLGNPTVRVIGAENVKQILLGENTIVTHNWPTSTRILLGAGSISQSKGFEHKIRRKHMLHAFNTDTLQEFVPVMQDFVQNSISTWINKRDILTYPECNLMTLQTSSCLLVGLEPDSACSEELHVTFMDFLKNVITLPFDVPGFGFRKAMNAKRKLIENLRKLLPETLKKPYTPIMRAYYDASGKLESSAEEIYEGVLDLLFAGHETIASGSTNCVMFLGQNKRVVDKLREELAEHGLGACSARDLTYGNIGELKYLNCVVKEVLRLCPPAGAGFRKALKSFELAGYLIPAGWTVIFSIRETQHTSDIFVESERFDPDRWLSPDVDSQASRFHYIPFGAGTRACVGKAYAQLFMKVFIIELIRMADWTLKNANPEMRYIPIPIATDHLPASFRKRAENIGSRSPVL